MAKKFTEEELEHDALIDNYARLEQFYYENKTVVIGSAVVVVLAIVLALGYHYYEKTQNTKAQQVMAMAEDAFLQANYGKALNGSDKDLTIGFKQIIDNYSSTKAGNLARYYAAICEFHLGKTQEALSYINAYEIPDGILGVAPLSFRALLLTQTGKHTEAAKAYIKAAEWNKNDSTTPYNYLEAAYAYQEAGNNAQASTYAQKVIDDYPESSQMAAAKSLLGELMGAKEK